MLSTTSILSRDQGKLFPKPKSEDEYYARFVTKDSHQYVAKLKSVWRFSWPKWHRHSAPKVD